MSNVTNPIQALSDIFYKPSEVFDALNVKHNWSWIPFILVTLIAIMPSYLYFGFVDFEWYEDLIISLSAADTSPNEQQAMREGMSPGAMQIVAVVSGVFVPVILSAIVATYLNLVTKNDEVNTNGFTDWYGFTWWTSLPTIFNGFIAILIIVLASDHQLMPNSLYPLSATYLLNVSLESDWVQWAQMINFPAFWGIYLTGVGITRWTSIKGAKAYLIAAAPYTVILVVWAAFILV